MTDVSEHDRAVIEAAEKMVDDLKARGAFVDISVKRVCMAVDAKREAERPAPASLPSAGSETDEQIAEHVLELDAEIRTLCKQSSYAAASQKTAEAGAFAPDLARRLIASNAALKEARERLKDHDMIFLSLGEWIDLVDTMLMIGSHQSFGPLTRIAVASARARRDGGKQS